MRWALDLPGKMDFKRHQITTAKSFEKKAFTMNVTSEKYVKGADYFDITSGMDTDKFVKTHLTAVKSDLVDALI